MAAYWSWYYLFFFYYILLHFFCLLVFDTLEFRKGSGFFGWFAFFMFIKSTWRIIALGTDSTWKWQRFNDGPQKPIVTDYGFYFHFFLTFWRLKCYQKSDFAKFGNKCLNWWLPRWRVRRVAQCWQPFLYTIHAFLMSTFILLTNMIQVGEYVRRYIPIQSIFPVHLFFMNHLMNMKIKRQAYVWFSLKTRFFTSDDFV